MIKVVGIRSHDGMETCCIKIMLHGYEISISVDNSCGAKRELFRTNLCVFEGNDGPDVTDKFLKIKNYHKFGIDMADSEVLFNVMKAIEMKEIEKAEKK